MILQLQDIITKIQETFPGKPLFLKLGQEESALSRIIGGQHGNYRVVVKVDEHDDRVEVINVGIKFLCENVPQLMNM